MRSGLRQPGEQGARDRTWGRPGGDVPSAHSVSPTAMRVPVRLPLLLLAAVASATAGCDSAEEPPVVGDLIVTYVADGDGHRVRLETEDAYTCPPPLAVRWEGDRDGVQAVVDGLSGPLGPCDQQGFAAAEVPVEVRLGTYDVEIVHRGQTDLYAATNGVVFSFEAVRTSVTRPGPR